MNTAVNPIQTDGGVDGSASEIKGNLFVGQRGFWLTAISLRDGLKLQVTQQILVGKLQGFGLTLEKLIIEGQHSVKQGLGLFKPVEMFIIQLYFVRRNSVSGTHN